MLLALCSLLISSSIVFITLEADAQSYTVSFAKPLYPPLTNGTWVRMLWHDTTNQYSFITLPGESFSFFGTAFPLTIGEQIGISTKGKLKFQHGHNAVILDPFFTDIGFDSLTTEAGIRWAIDGAAGAYILKIEYNHVNFKGRDSSVYVSFQIWLWEQTGEIDLHYLANSIPGNEFYGNAKGPYVGLFMSDTLFTTYRHIAWLTGQASGPSVTTSAITSLTGTPSFGANFELIPTSSLVSNWKHHVDDVSIYPNPARNTIRFVGGSEAQSGTVTGILGNVELLVKNTAEIDISQLPPGCHYLDVTSRGKNERLKFVKE